jgi:aspartyl-tRNA(Asn)/glutamyl-tRNA(Gln) amidotransferase subunit A
MTAPWELGAIEAAAAIAAGELAPSELVASVLERIEQVEPLVNAFVSVDAEGALRTAREQDGRRGGPLHGLPLVIKDIFDVEGLPTGCGSAAYDGAPAAAADAAAVARLRSAGAILLGKTRTHELACGVYTAPTRNPWDLGCSPGGSSGGSAAAVAAGAALGGIGSDTGGSIRIPASHCGLAGLKPTYDAVSRGGALALSWSLDHVGPLARSVGDAALLFSVLADRPPAAGGVDGLRVGLLRDAPFAPVEADVAAGLDEAVAILRGEGVLVADVAIPELVRSLVAEFAIVAAEAASYHEARLAQAAELIADDVRGLLELGLLLPASTYLRAQRTRRRLQQAVADAFTEHRLDALLAPTVPAAAQRVDQLEYELGGTTEPVIEALVRTTAPFNLTGLPAAAVPVGLGAGGLPRSVQLVTRPFAEQTALDLARAIEGRAEPLGTPAGLERALVNPV